MVFGFIKYLAKQRIDKWFPTIPKAVELLDSNTLIQFTTNIRYHPEQEEQFLLIQNCIKYLYPMTIFKIHQSKGLFEVKIIKTNGQEFILHSTKDGDVQLSNIAFIMKRLIRQIE